MRRKPEIELYNAMLTERYYTLFFMIKSVLGGVILRKYLNLFTTKTTEKVKTWESVGLVETHTISGQQLITLRPNKSLNLTFSPRLTPTMITRSCLRMERYMEELNGFEGIPKEKRAERICHLADRGLDKACFSQVTYDALKSWDYNSKMKSGKDFQLFTQFNIEVLEKLQHKNLFPALIRIEGQGQAAFLKPEISYYLLRRETPEKVIKELEETYADIISVFGENTRPIFKVYVFGRDKLPNQVYSLLQKSRVFASWTEDQLKATIQFHSYKEPLTYIELKNLV